MRSLASQARDKITVCTIQYKHLDVPLQVCIMQVLVLASAHPVAVEEALAARDLLEHEAQVVERAALFHRLEQQRVPLLHASALEVGGWCTGTLYCLSSCMYCIRVGERGAPSCARGTRAAAGGARAPRRSPCPVAAPTPDETPAPAAPAIHISNLRLNFLQL